MCATTLTAPSKKLKVKKKKKMADDDNKPPVDLRAVYWQITVIRVLARGLSILGLTLVRAIEVSGRWTWGRERKFDDHTGMPRTGSAINPASVGFLAAAMFMLLEYLGRGHSHYLVWHICGTEYPDVYSMENGEQKVSPRSSSKNI